MFNYPGPFPPVAFEAELFDQAGAISGTISEPDESARGGTATLRSIVDGSREGNAVSFEFSSYRRMWYACLACEHVWLGPRQE